MNAAEPGIHIVKEPLRIATIGMSRLGGLPDVPANFVWPRCDQRPLTLLAQVNCEEVAPFDFAQTLPSSGVLYFFYDVEEQPWGFDPKDRAGSTVIYHTEAELRPAPRPTDLGSALCLPSIPVSFKSTLTIPTYGSAAYDSLFIDEDEEQDAYAELCEAIDFGFDHRLLGHSNNIQGDMQLECQLVSNGVYAGCVSDDYDRQVKLLGPGAADWCLLLQFGSDDDMGTMWGDCGTVYFWIRRQMLRERDFTKTWTILQCS